MSRSISGETKAKGGLDMRRARGANGQVLVGVLLVAGAAVVLAVLAVPGVRSVATPKDKASSLQGDWPDTLPAEIDADPSSAADILSDSASFAPAVGQGTSGHLDLGVHSGSTFQGAPTLDSASPSPAMTDTSGDRSDANELPSGQRPGEKPTNLGDQTVRPASADPNYRGNGKVCCQPQGPTPPVPQ